MHHTHPYIKTYDNYPQITALKTRTIGSFRPSGKAKNKTKIKEMNKLRLNGVSRSQMNEVSVPSESNQTKIWVICMFSIWSWTFSGNFTFTCSRLAPVEAPDRAVLVRDGVSSVTNRKLSEQDPNLPRPSLSQQAAVSESVIISSISLFHSFRQTTISCLSNRAFTAIWDRAGRHDSIKCQQYRFRYTVVL